MNEQNENSKIFEIFENEKEKFQIKIESLGNNLSVYAKKELKFSLSEEFQSKFSLDDIKKVRYFQIYDSVDECLEDIFKGINTSKSSLKKENNNLIITIPLLNKKYPSISFSLKEKVKNDKDIIKE